LEYFICHPFVGYRTHYEFNSFILRGIIEDSDLVIF